MIYPMPTPWPNTSSYAAVAASAALPAAPAPGTVFFPQGRTMTLSAAIAGWPTLNSLSAAGRAAGR